MPQVKIDDHPSQNSYWQISDIEYYAYGGECPYAHTPLQSDLQDWFKTWKWEAEAEEKREAEYEEQCELFRTQADLELALDGMIEALD